MNMLDYELFQVLYAIAAENGLESGDDSTGRSVCELDHLWISGEVIGHQ